MSLVSIKRALISVSDKTGLIDLVTVLNNLGIEIISTGGTMTAILKAGLEVTAVEDFTGMPPIMGGRLKTLHQKVFGNLLSRLGNTTDTNELKRIGVASIHLVVVNLYPFEQKLAEGVPEAELIENIDIGGPSIIRSGAKNYERVTVIHSPNQYQGLVDQFTDNGGQTTLAFRRECAGLVYAYTAAYDKAVANYFAGNV